MRVTRQDYACWHKTWTWLTRTYTKFIEISESGKRHCRCVLQGRVMRRFATWATACRSQYHPVQTGTIRLRCRAISIDYKQNEWCSRSQLKFRWHPILKYLLVVKLQYRTTVEDILEPVVLRLIECRIWSAWKRVCMNRGRIFLNSYINRIITTGSRQRLFSCGIPGYLTTVWFRKTTEMLERKSSNSTLAQGTEFSQFIVSNKSWPDNLSRSAAVGCFIGRHCSIYLLYVNACVLYTVVACDDKS